MFSYLILMIVVLALGLGAQGYIKSTYTKWSKIPISNGLTGAQAARKMLDENGLSNVQIVPINGTLTDNFNPKTQVLSLSNDVYNGVSVSATAVACHESGHAVQTAAGYTPAKIRTAIVPVVNFASQAWVIVFFAGVFLNLLGLVKLGILLFAVAIVFQLVTLPVEFDASHRAVTTIGTEMLPAAEVTGARKVLTAAALTYVAAALASILQLLYFIGMSNN